MSGCRVSGCRVALEMGFRSVWGCVRSGRAQKPHTRPTTPAPAPKKIYTGRVKHKHVAWCLKREELGRVSIGSTVSRRQRKREKVTVWPGPRSFKAGHETDNFEEFCVRWRGPCASKGGAEHERAKVSFTNITSSPEERERGRESGGCTRTKRV